MDKLKIFNNVALGIKFSYNQMKRLIISREKSLSKNKISVCLKWTYGLFCNEYRVAMLSKLYPTHTPFIMQSF